MPYYKHAKSSEPITGTVFAFHSEARVNFDPQAECITYVSEPEEFNAWADRESARFSNGTYKRVPWPSLPGDGNVPEICKYHYPHLSTKSPGLIAYTKDFASGHEDKQTAIKPGKYLTQFYADVFSHAEITAYANACNAEIEVLKFAFTPDDIQTVYENGPRSCMAHTYGEVKSNCKVCNRDDEATHYNYTSEEHPVRVYGDSPDLAIAYYGTLERPSARGLVWPDKKIYGSLYGCEDILESLLRNAGYTQGSLKGARIRAIKDGSGWLMPYIDDYREVGGLHTSDDGKRYFKIGHSGFEADGTTGTTDDQNRFVCSSCGDSFHEDDFGGEGMCNDCYSDAYSYCEECNESVPNDDMCCVRPAGARYDKHMCESCRDSNYTACEDCSTYCANDDVLEIAGDYYCHDCGSNHGHTCEVCREDFYDTDSGAKFCEDCDGKYTYCDTCEDWIDNTEIPKHDRTSQIPYAGENERLDGIRPEIDLTVPDASYGLACTDCGRTLKDTQTLAFDWNSVAGSTADTPDYIETDTRNRYHLDVRYAPLPEDTHVLNLYKRISRVNQYDREKIEILYKRDFYNVQWMADSNPNAVKLSKETREKMYADLGLFPLNLFYRSRDAFYVCKRVDGGYWSPARYSHDYILSNPLADDMPVIDVSRFLGLEVR